MKRATLDPEQLVESLVRLRRITPHLDEQSRQEIDPVIELLEEAVAPTLNQSQAARLLGVSHTAVGRWIEKGDITTVPTPAGRHEIPLGQLIELVDSVQQDRPEFGRRALAETIRAQRRRAKKLDVDSLLPRRARGGHGHRKAELRSLGYHRAVADRLDARMIMDAKRRLRRWKQQGRIHPTWAEEWEKILEQPPAEIAKLLRSDTERAQDLRQNSPFAGVLSEHERRRVIEAVEQVTS